jgi:hypothetical protein
MTDDLVRLMAAVDGEDPSPEFVSALRNEIDTQLVDSHDGAGISIRFADRSVKAANESGDEVSAGDRLRLDEVTAPTQRRRSPDESVTRGSLAASIDTANCSPGAEVREQPDDDLRVDYLLQFDEVTASQEPRRWTGLAAVAAATVLVAVGVVVATRESSDDPVSSPTLTDPVPTAVVADPLLYQWSRVAAVEAVFGGDGHQAVGGVTVGGPGLVAVGWEEDSVEKVDNWGVVWTSVDGLTWSRVPDDDAVFADSGLADVTAGGPGLVAVGGFGVSETPADEGTHPGVAAAWTSLDGLTWTRVPHDDAVFGGAEMHSVTVGGPGLVAVGTTQPEILDEALTDYERANLATDAAVWTSVDGLTWSRVPHDEAIFGGAGAQQMRDVAAGGPGLVAVGYDGTGPWDNTFGQVAAVWTSVDGLIWSRVPHDDAAFGGDKPAMLGVTAGGPGLVAVGYSFGHSAPAAVWTSVDGLSWSRVAHDAGVGMGGTMWSVAVGGPGLVAVGEAGNGGAAAWFSPDGLTWVRGTAGDLEPSPRDGSRIYDVIDTGSRLVAFGGLDSYGDEQVAVWTTPTR